LPARFEARCARHHAVATALALLGDRELGELVDGALLVGSTIGGRAVVLDIAGTRVFAKRVPLTDLERQPDNVGSTANLFELPTFYQYRVGSAGFGVWRELAAHAMTTAWVLGQECESFPLMHHWRVLDAPAPDEAPDALERMVAYWDGSPAVRARLEAIACSSASVVMFLEYIPHTLHEWLTAQLALGDAAVAAACAMVARTSSSVVSFMRSNELLHLDTHFHNILTDGERLYFADFGLAMSRRFALSEPELSFFDDHTSYDGCVTVTELVNWLGSALVGEADREAFIRRCAGGATPPEVPGFAAAILQRHAPIAVVLNDFFRRLRFGSKTTGYPIDEIRRLYDPDRSS
jgi:hypothetical protein